MDAGRRAGPGSGHGASVLCSHRMERRREAGLGLYNLCDLFIRIYPGQHSDGADCFCVVPVSYRADQNRDHAYRIFESGIADLLPVRHPDGVLLRRI